MLARSSVSAFQHPGRSFFGAILIVVLGFLFVTVSSRLTGEIGSSSNPISGMTVATLLLTCLIFLHSAGRRRSVLRHGALGRRHRLHRRVERRHDVAGSEDRLPGRRHAAQPADRDPRRRARLGARARPAAHLLNNSRTYYQKVDAASAEGEGRRHGETNFSARTARSASNRPRANTRASTHRLPCLAEHRPRCRPGWQVSGRARPASRSTSSIPGSTAS